MKRLFCFAAVMFGLSVPSTLVSAQDSDRIWGRVLTTDGDRYEGFIRWDRNEANWGDLFDGTRDIVWEDLDRWEDAIGERDDENDRSIEFMGIRVSWDDDDSAFPEDSNSAIRFGHIERLTVTGRQRALLRLRSGDDVEFSGGSTDIGPEIRELLVEDPDRGTVDLRWRELDEIEFSQAPASARAEGHRLYGTVVDYLGNEYSGQISWDLDEVLDTDILDGDEDRREREVPFGSIAAIERLGRRGSLVTLKSGQEMILSGTNDVDRGHRGVQISDPTFGQIDIDWDEFDSIRFHEPVAARGLSGYDGGHRLRGTVETETGESVTGWIRWDADETYSWEILNGESDEVTFDIEFGQVGHIEKVSWHSADVTLLDGRVLHLDESNDVDENNRGIFIETDSGEKVVIDWFDFASITFDHN